MAFAKKELFLQKDQQVGMYSLALSHPARACILRELEIRKGMYVHEIESLIPLTQPAVSTHLVMLRRADLIDVDVQGRYNFYTVKLENMRKAKATVVRFYDEILHEGATTAEADSGARSPDEQAASIENHEYMMT